MAISRRLSGSTIAVILLVSSMAYYWWWQRDYHRIRSEVQVLIAQTVFPYPINGFKLTLQGVSSISGPADFRNVFRADRTLIVAAADDCDICVKLQPALRAYLADEVPTDIVLVGIRSTGLVVDLANAVAGKGRTPTVLTTSQVEDFQLGTGIMATPTMVVVDRDSRVRFVTHGLDEISRQALARVLNGH
jgi:hypothetical protein